MQKSFRSISWKIWYSMARIIVFLFILIIFANIVIINNAQEDFIFDQLKEAADAKKAAEQSFVIPNENMALWVAHFRIEIAHGKVNVLVDQFTKSLYIDQEPDAQIIERIADQVVDNGVQQNRGIINDHRVKHYYYADWDEDGKAAMVFITTGREKNPFVNGILAIVIVLLIITFITSRIAAKKIAKPIQELEVFAEEVSKRNWNAKVPKKEHNEIGLLAIALEKMRDSLKIAEERDRQFLQSTSHDLKTPVMIIKGYAQAMLDGIGIDSQKSATEVIKKEADRLERRIMQLLRLNTLGHSLEYNENRQIVRIDRLLNSLVSKLRVVRPELDWNLDLKEFEVKGDPEALLIAFENIIDNQLRYAKNLISIVMEISDGIEIIISNDGPSFETEDPMMLFDAYKKDKEGKFGLGLAIVKQVIESHGGSVIAYNTANGVEFKIRIQEEL